MSSFEQKAVEPRAVIFVASLNQVKLHAVEQACGAYLIAKIYGRHVESKVSEQPFNGEILEGAKNRIANLKELLKTEQITHARLLIAIEGGLFTPGDGTFSLGGIIAVEDCHNERLYTTETPRLPLPEKFNEKLRLGQSINKICEQITNIKNIGHGIGLTSLLTNHTITRTSYIKHTLILLLAPILSPQYR